MPSFADVGWQARTFDLLEREGEKEGGGGGYGGEEERYSIPEVSFAWLSSKEKVYVFDFHCKVRFVKYLRTKLSAYRAKKGYFLRIPSQESRKKQLKKCSNIGFFSSSAVPDGVKVRFGRSPCVLSVPPSFFGDSIFLPTSNFLFGRGKAVFKPP